MKAPILFFGLACFIFYTCKKDNDPVEIPPQVNQEETITTLTIFLKDSLGLKPDVWATFRDPDGSGPETFIRFDTITLAENTTYLAKLILLDETKLPVDTISQEILKEAQDHLFCFDPMGISILISRTDSDGTYGLGLKTTWRTGPAGVGDIKITLKHQPEIKNGTCGLGETDIELTFYTIILT